MKLIRTFLIASLIIFSNIGMAQHRWIIIKDHPLYPFSKYEGDTVAYLTRNFDGGADSHYYGQPLSRYLQDLDPAMPIRTFYLYDVPVGNDCGIAAFFCFPYTKEQLKELVKKGERIYGIGLTFDGILSVTQESELYNYFRNLGLGRILPWTPEIEQKIGHLIFAQGSVQEATPTVKRYLEYHP